ncbi:hypothetical protein CMI37_26825 [Candidatus Pacearchaeota archaeon]|nr:hypothetical protein [Candidatus Pacearchaeota archaeon]|tara:strand:- start:641 stop:1135 length:495 start_codon:yes stop_codon:yes gene_type:complete
MDALIIFLVIVFLILLVVAYFLGKREGCSTRDRHWEGELPSYRKDAIMRSRAVLGGHFSEQLAPYLPDFEHLPNECKFIGKPIDFIVFKGMDEKEIEEIVFVEVKSGNARLSPVEKKLKDVVEKKKVRWVEYRIPPELTQKGNIEERISDIVDEGEGKKGKKKT